MLAKFRQRYPQGSLVSELVQIDRGIYIVKASVQIDGIVLATALAGADTVENAEDAARERAIAALGLDSYSTSNNINSAIANTTNDSPISPQAKTKLDSEPLIKPKPLNDATIVNFPQAKSEVSSHSKPDSETAEMAEQVVPQRISSQDAMVSNSLVESSSSSLDNIPEQVEQPVQPPSISSNLFADTFSADIPDEVSLSEQNVAGTNSVKDFATTTSESEMAAMDFNEIKQKTDIEIKRLSWTKDQGKEFLMSRYGKRSRLHLTDEQLLEFLRYLEKLPNPIK